jgi:hypothetical protein
MFSAVTLMVMVTTFMAPPLLKALFSPKAGRRRRPESNAVQELTSGP